MHNRRLDQLTDYPFQRLRMLLRDVAPPAGLEPIALQIGEPHHAPPDFLAPILTEHTADWGRYPPIDGTQALRTAIHDWLVRRYRLPDDMIDANRHILPVAGTREALFSIALSTVPTDQASKPVVLMPNPLYPVYLGAAVMVGAEPMMVPATKDNGFQPDYANLPAPVLDRTALAYINSPANPQGSVLDLDTQRKLIELARTHGFAIAFDECYGEIYCDEPPTGALEACATMDGELTNVLVFHSLSKRSSVPGLRSGFVVGDADLIRRFGLLRDYGGATVPIPVMAASAALWADEDHVEASRALYRRKFDIALDLLDGACGATKPGGSFFLWLEVGDGEACARRLWAEAAIRVLPGAYLARANPDGNPGAPFIRVALVNDPETIETAIGRMTRVLSS